MLIAWFLSVVGLRRRLRCPAQAAANAVIAAATDQVRRTTHPPTSPGMGDLILAGPVGRAGPDG